MNSGMLLNIFPDLSNEPANGLSVKGLGLRVKFGNVIGVKGLRLRVKFGNLVLFVVSLKVLQSYSLTVFHFHFHFYC